MSSADQKIPFAQSLNFYTDRKIGNALQASGQSYPCYVVSISGAIVTVAFDISVPANISLPQVTCPVFGPEYIRYPIKAGDKGVCFSADVSLRKVSGLGTGTPDFSPPGNLSALVFFPVGNKNWSSVDPNAVVISAPNGVVLKTDSGVSNITVDTATISLSSPIITSSALGVNTVSGEVVMLGQGGYGNLSTLPNGGGTLFENTVVSGASAIYSNPISANCNTLLNTISAGTIQSGLTTLVTAGTITSLQRTNIINSLNSITTSTTNLVSHSNLISGLGSITSNVPNLNGIIGTSLAAVFSAGGAFGSSSTLITGMTTALTGNPTLASTNSYCNGIIAGLTALTLTPAAVIATNLANSGTLQGFVNTDTTAFSTIQSQMASTSVFLQGVGNAQSTDVGVSNLIAQVIPPATLTTLQGV